MTDIKPKLDILSFLAQENSKESADRRREKVNENATLPRFQVGDKVLLHNPVTKKGMSEKLTVRYEGPYLLQATDDRFNYHLQHLHTGKTLKRPVHCSRLKPLNELENDYRIKPLAIEPSLFTGVTSDSQLNVRVLVGDPLIDVSGAIVVYTDGQLAALAGVSQTVHEAGGVGLREECLSHITGREPPDVVITSAGNISGARRTWRMSLLTIIDRLTISC